jgi:alpha-amylase
MFTSFATALIATVAVAQTDCSYFYNLGCTSGSVTTNPPDWANRSFQTPLPGSAHYKPEYEGLGRVMCYNNIQYASDRKSATVEARCRTHSSVSNVSYNWNGEGFTSSKTYAAGSALGGKALSLVVKATDNAGVDYTITMESLNFIWQGAAINQSSVYQNGQKGGIVEMFGWPHEDVKQECAYLAKMGWMGVKVFPVSESVFSYEWPQNGELNPWWFYY